MDDEWTEVAYIEHPDRDEPRDELARVLDEWLNQHGLTRAEVDEADVRLDLVHLGPGNGCAHRLLVRTAVAAPTSDT